MIRRAILEAARAAHAEDRPTLTQDVRDAFFTLAEQAQTDMEANKLRNMGQAIDMYTHALQRRGVQLGRNTLAGGGLVCHHRSGRRRSYESNLTIAGDQLLNRINHIGAQSDSRTGDRVTIDGSHVVTATNPLLALRFW